MSYLIKVQKNQKVHNAVELLLAEAGNLENYQAVYNQNYSLDNASLKEQSYGSVIAGEEPHRREYEVIVAECSLRFYGYKASKYQIHLVKISQSQSDIEEQEAAEDWLRSKGI